MRRNSRSRVLILLLIAVLAATPVLASPRETAPVPRQTAGIFASFWELLEGFLAKGLSTIDPNGTPGAESDGRSTIDPDGYTVPSGGESDGRSTIDPNG